VLWLILGRVISGLGVLELTSFEREGWAVGRIPRFKGVVLQKGRWCSSRSFRDESRALKGYKGRNKRTSGVASFTEKEKDK